MVRPDYNFYNPFVESQISRMGRDEALKLYADSIRIHGLNLSSSERKGQLKAIDCTYLYITINNLLYLLDTYFSEYEDYKHYFL